MEQQPSAATGAPTVIYDPNAGQQPQQSGGYRGAHPCAAFFHIIFKLLAILAYLIGGIFGGSSISQFIFVILFLAADFWTVKNVSGRLLVALRWWNQIDDDGKSTWIFESGTEANKVNEFDAYFFWVSTYGACVVWLVFTIFGFTSFSKLPMTLLGLALSGSNAVGYTKCRRDAKKKMSKFLMQQAVQNPGLFAAAR